MLSQIDYEEESDTESLQYSLEESDSESLQYSLEESDTESLQYSLEESDTESLFKDSIDSNQYSVEENDLESIESLKGENIQELEGDNVSKNLEEDELIGLDIVFNEPMENEKALDLEKTPDLVKELAKINGIENNSKYDLDKSSKIKEILVSRSKSKSKKKSPPNFPNDIKSKNNNHTFNNKTNQELPLAEQTKPQKTQNMKRKSSAASKISNKRRFKKKQGLPTIPENKEINPKMIREIQYTQKKVRLKKGRLM